MGGQQAHRPTGGQGHRPTGGGPQGHRPTGGGGYPHQGTFHQAPSAIQNALANVCAQLGNTPTVQHFFNAYDCYEGRIFEIWELVEICNLP